MGAGEMEHARRLLRELRNERAAFERALDKAESRPVVCLVEVDATCLGWDMAKGDVMRVAEIFGVIQLMRNALPLIRVNFASLCKGDLEPIETGGE